MHLPHNNYNHDNFFYIVPGSVSNVSVLIKNSTSLDVSWTYEQAAAQLTHYTVVYMTHCQNQMQWNMKNVFGENLTITELEEGQNYTISITPVSCSRQPGTAKHVFGITTEAGAASDVQKLTCDFNVLLLHFLQFLQGLLLLPMHWQLVKQLFLSAGLKWIA